MGMAVAIVPGAFVSVVAAGRDEAVEHGGEIAGESVFELDGADGCGAADVEDMGQSGGDAGVAYDGGDGVGDFSHLAVVLGGDGDGLLIGHDRLGGRFAFLIGSFEDNTACHA